MFKYILFRFLGNQICNLIFNIAGTDISHCTLSYMPPKQNDTLNIKWVTVGSKIHENRCKQKI